MSSNNLSAFSSNAFNELRKLNHIDFSYNQIRNINIHDFHFHIFHEKRNITIDLSHNKIRTIDFDELEKFAKGEYNYTINLNYNPVLCDCYLHNFVKCLQVKKDTCVPSTSNITYKTSELFCSDAVEGVGNKKMADLNPEKLYCILDKDIVFHHNITTNGAKSPFDESLCP